MPEIPDPDSVARARELAAEHGVTDPASRAALDEVASLSRLMGRWLAGHPEALARLIARAPASMLDEARAVRGAHPSGPGGLRAALRALRIVETARALRADLGGAGVTDVTRAFSDLASASLELALAETLAAHATARGAPMDESGAPIPFVIVGMGKLGGRELNLSSDIDVVYVHGTDRGAISSRAEAPSEYFARVATELTRALADVTEDGLAFRVDLNLRPEGTRGPITNSLRSLEVYYESYGATWERAAWLKARPVAGDPALGEAVMRAVEPFVYRRWLDLPTLDAIREMKDRIDRSRVTHGAAAGAIEHGYDVKLGAGGIREVEFFVQALQLVNAGKRPDVRARGTLDGLARLAAAGLLPEGDAARLAAAYEFLRRLEHHLQARELAQTHTLPTDAAELGVIAVSMGFPREGSALLSALAAHRAVVAGAFDELFREKSRRAAEAAGPEVALVSDETLSEERGVALARGLGIFTDPASAAESFARIRLGPTRSREKERAFRYLARIAPTLFAELRGAPDPDAAVVNLERFLAKIGGRTTLLAILAEHPPAAATLTRLFGTSEFLTRAFLGRPELLDVLMGSGIARPMRRRAELRAELADTTAAAPDYEAKLDVLRRFRVGEMLRIGIADLAGALALEALQRQLSDVAQTVVERALHVVCAEDRCGAEGLVVLAMGRLGGREMAYASDVDLVFFCDAVDDRKIRIAQRVLSALSAPTREGIAYRVDTRLRPSGSAGLLVVSLAAFHAYHQTQARTWERQAWVRARPIAGDLAWWNRSARAEVRTRIFRPLPDGAGDLAREVREMRAMLEKQIGRGVTETYNLKTGFGGLVDVEFAAQFLQLSHGVGDASMRTPHTLSALRRAQAAGHLAADDFSALSEGYRFVHHLENRLRIVADRPVDEVPASDEAWDTLARAARVDPGAASASGSALRAEYVRISTAVRAAFERVLNV